ncbi:CRISPR-associated helicase Cas3' [Bacillus sp. Hm123]|uniref:CRISPR-associated helicase Cas3' n=1 Tax=Bacillus sp. Hm123 TaxID=3450745 RepID=UPI003F44048F
MFDRLLAKSEKGNQKEETIMEHTNELLNRHAQLKELYPHILSDSEWNLLYKACYCHDLGKANTKFQNKIRKKEEQIIDPLPDLPEIPHGYLSAAFLSKKELAKELTNDEIGTLYKAVFYHHEREEDSLDVRRKTLEEDVSQYIDSLKTQGFQVDKVKTSYARYLNKAELRGESLHQFIKIKGLLNKLDFAASAHVEAEISHDSLVQHLNNFMQEKGFSRNELQQYLYERQDQNHVVIASTGIGKTEAALCWIGDSKGIFTLPLKVSINAIYDRMKEDLKYEPVGLLHSDTLSEYLQRATEDESFNPVLVTQTRQLSYPLTICTIDQLIDFVAMYPGFEMKLAVLSYSKLVIDEIQMYSPRLAAFIILGLKKIVDMGGQFTILTATFPPLLGEQMRQMGIPFEQREEPFLKKDENGQTIVRHFMEVREKDLTIEDIIQNGVDQKVLVIVNTVTKAQKLYDDFKAIGINPQLLHSRFIQTDRARKEQNILEMGKHSNESVGVWITTQVVEASVDIDFDVLFTELSEASGLFQRMGRVYRKRSYDQNKPNVFVYTGEDLPSGISRTSKKSVVDATIFERSKEELLPYSGDFVTEEDKMNIVEKIYTMKSLENSNYLREFRNTINDFGNLLAYELDSKPKLRDIDNQNIIPYSVYEENEQQILALQSILNEKNPWQEKVKASTELKKYVVAIPTWAYKNAQKQKLIGLVIRAGGYQTYPVIQFKYSQAVGLTYSIDEDSQFM